MTDEETVKAVTDAILPLCIKYEDIPKIARAAIAAMPPREVSVQEAAKVLLDSVDSIQAMVSHAQPILRFDIPQHCWNEPSEISDAITAALRALTGDTP